jgi:hypothetical protein
MSMNKALFRIRDQVWVKNPDPDPGSRMNNPHNISESLETIFGVKILKFFDAERDGKKFGPGSGIKTPYPQHWKKGRDFFSRF